jgi:hypothetical protein
LKEALVMENLEALGACAQQLEQAAQGQRDAGDALIGMLSQVSALFNFHEAEVRAWAEEDPRLRPVIRKFIIWLDRVLDSETGLEGGGAETD